MFKGSLRALLYVRNVEDSVRFYRDVLGWKLKNTFGNDYAIVHASGETVGLHTTDGDPVGVDGKIFYVQVTDVNKYHGKVLAAGATVSELRDQPWSERDFYVKDPDGHQWGFYQRLKAGKKGKAVVKKKPLKSVAPKGKGTTKAKVKVKAKSKVRVKKK